MRHCNRELSRRGVAAVARWAFSIVALLSAVAPARALVVIDSEGFNAPLYSTTFMGDGRLEGQQDWKRTPFSGTATVQDAVVMTADPNDQAVRVDRAANADDRWVRQVTGFPTERFITTDWDMRVEQSTGPNDAFGPYLGVELVDDTVFPPVVGVFATLGVDAKTGDVLYQEQDTGFLVETGVQVGFGDWNHFQILLDFQEEEYSTFLNGVFLAKTGFIDRALGLDDFVQAGLLAAAAQANPSSQSLTGTAYFDNFVVIQLPEPGGLMWVALGLLGVRRGARRRTIASSAHRGTLCQRLEG